MNTEILIAGGGIIGLSAALAMKQCGFDVMVVDKRSSFTTHIKRVYALNSASIQLLTLLKVWPTLKAEQLSPYKTMHIWDHLTQAVLNFDTRMLGKSELGFIIEEPDLKQALLMQCELQNISVLSDIEITDIKENDNTIIANPSHTPISAQFMLITDGANSQLRQMLKVPVTTWPYHQHALIATIKTEKAHQQTAYQVFTAEGPLAFLPLVDPHTCSIVWSTSTAKAKALANIPTTDFNPILTQTFENKLGQCELLSERHCFELQMRHVQQYVGTRWALMGDAAHTIHPLAGLGLNLGLADVNTWLNHFVTHQKFSSHMLLAYQRERKYEAWQVIGLMDGLKFIFTHPLPAVHLLRNLGMQAIHHLTPLKRLIMGYAADFSFNSNLQYAPTY